MLEKILLFVAEERFMLWVVRVAALGALVVLGGIIIRQLADVLTSATRDSCEKK